MGLADFVDRRVQRSDVMSTLASTYGRRLKDNPHRKHLGTLLVGVLTIGAVVVARSLGHVGLIFWPAIAAAGVSQLWHLVREYCEALYDSEVQADQETVLVRTQSLSGGLRDVQNKVAELIQATPSKREDISQETANLVVNSILNTYVSVPDVRASVFVIHPGDNCASPIVSRGRQDEPRIFNRGDGGRGDRFFKWVDGTDHHPRFSYDTQEDPEHSGELESRRYRTYVSAQIYNASDVYGMLTVDAPQPSSLDVADKHLLQAFASELATAFTVKLPTKQIKSTPTETTP